MGSKPLVLIITKNLPMIQIKKKPIFGSHWELKGDLLTLNCLFEAKVICNLRHEQS